MPASLDDLIPAWDETGALVPLGKLDVHRRGLRHPAISVFVTCGDAVLIQQRAFGKYHTLGLWANTCCTHPHWGEDPRTCATRRLAEELGISGLRLTHRGQVEYRAAVPGKGEMLTEHELVEVFVAEAPRDWPMALNPAEVTAVRWVTRADLAADIASNPASFTPWLRIYLADHSDLIFGSRQTAQNFAR